jgi:hypothetical protein
MGVNSAERVPMTSRERPDRAASHALSRSPWLMRE